MSDRHIPERQGRTNVCVCGEPLANADAHTRPCANCDGTGRTMHQVPGVPSEVCVRSSPCEVCWPSAGWVTAGGGSDE